MKTIITGGTGLIGFALAEKMTLDGHQVVILSRNPEKHVSRFSNGIQLVCWDGSTLNGWGHSLDGSDVVVNLAGASIAGNSFAEVFSKRWSPARKRVIRDSRLNAGLALVEAIMNVSRKPSVFIQGSAVGYYGSRGDEELYDNTPPGDDFLANVCLDWENPHFRSKRWVFEEW